jgi:hypothetical protein
VGRLTRVAGAMALAGIAWLLGADAALGFDGFGDGQAESTYG